MCNQWKRPPTFKWLLQIPFLPPSSEFFVSVSFINPHCSPQIFGHILLRALVIRILKIMFILWDSLGYWFCVFINSLAPDFFGSVIYANLPESLGISSLSHISFFDFRKFFTPKSYKAATTSLKAPLVRLIYCYSSFKLPLYFWY